MAELDVFKDLIFDLIERDEWEEIRTMLEGQHPADIAELIQAADKEHRSPLFALLAEDEKPDVLAELEAPISTQLLKYLSNEQISEIVEEMEPDDAADLLGDLSTDQSLEILQGMDTPESLEVRNLLRYDDETAGGIMTSHLIRFSANMTVTEAIDHLADVDIEEPFYNLYITDEQQKLIGVLGLWELLKQKDRHARVGDIAHADFVSVTTDVDQEKTAQIMAKYDLTSLPVLTPGGRLVGRITVDDVIDVMEEEATEDIMRMSGTSDEGLLHRTPLQACRYRLPWLLITLATGFITSFLFSEFIDNLEQVLVLSFFVPIVMAMGGNTGIQSSTLIIRRIAIGTMEADSIWRILGREIMGALLMGLICGIIISIWASFLVGNSADQASTFPPVFLGIVVGVSLLSAMVFAAVFGAFTPILLNRFLIDPAVASGPFVTASNDIFALLIYYGVTFGLVSFVGGA